MVVERLLARTCVQAGKYEYLRRVSHRSIPEEIRNRHKHNSQRDEQNSVGNEVGKDHQGQAANQGNNGSLFSAIHEKAKPD